MTRRHRRHWPVWGSALLAAVLTAWLIGFVMFLRDLPQPVPLEAARAAPTDGIVVLTGGADRIERGYALLAAGAGRALLISGVAEAVGPENLPGADQLRPELWACCVTLDRAAVDTRGNARETAAWANRLDLSSLRLVTAHYHMPRTLLEMRTQLPGHALIADPVVPAVFAASGAWGGLRLAPLMLREYNKLILTWLRIQLPLP